MKIFVTGATGVLGTRAVPALVAAGHDAVAHLATNIPPMSKAARLSAWETNERLRREASRHLVDAALTAGAERYVQESIAYPYLDGGDAWIDEDWPLEHEGPFAGAKVAEAQAARFTEAGGAGVALRFAQFHGPGAAHTEAFGRLVRRRINPFLGPPDSYTSFIHAEDAGSAVAAALLAPAGVYNVADDEPLTRRAAGDAVAEALGVKPPRVIPAAVQVLLPKGAKALARSLRISNGRFKAATGWAPAHRSMRGSWAAS